MYSALSGWISVHLYTCVWAAVSNMDLISAVWTEHSEFWMLNSEYMCIEPLGIARVLNIQTCVQIPMEQIQLRPNVLHNETWNRTLTLICLANHFNKLSVRSNCLPFPSHGYLKLSQQLWGNKAIYFLLSWCPGHWWLTCRTKGSVLVDLICCVCSKYVKHFNVANIRYSWKDILDITPNV